MGGHSMSYEELSDAEVQASTGFWKTRLVQLGIAMGLSFLIGLSY